MWTQDHNHHHEDSLFAPSFEDLHDLQYDHESFNATCSPEILQHFRDECGWHTLDLGAFVTMQTNAIAACCWEPHCCDHFLDVFDMCYADTYCQGLDYDTIQLMGVYHTLCANNDHHEHELECPTQNLDEITIDCQELNERLNEECGYQTGPTEAFIRPRDGKLASCCWPGTCCDLATEYYSKGCDLGCWVQEGGQKEYGQYVLGNGVASAWKDICVVPDEISVCQSVEVNDDIEKAGVAVESPEQFVDFRAYAIPFEGINGSVEVLTPSLIQQEEQQQQQMSVQQLVYDQQKLQDAGICYETMEEYKNTEYGPEGSWTATVRIFCNYTLADLRTSPNDAVRLCCEVTQEMFQGACKYYSCYSTSINLFSAKVFDILSLWQVVCSPQVDKCNLDDALALVSGGQQQQFQIIQDQDSTTAPLSAPITTPNFTVTATPTPTPNRDQSSSASTEELSIYRALELIPMLSTFYDGIQYIQLEETLASYEQKTSMFVPTNTAFSEFSQTLNASTDDIINSIGGTAWTAMHLVHVSLFAVQQEDLQLGEQQTLYTLESGQITIGKNDDGSMFVEGCCSPLNRVNVISFAVFKDGILWVVDRIILPTVIAERRFASTTP